MNEKTNNNRVVLKAVINYPELFQPKAFKDSPARYSACLLIPKDDKETLRRYQAALKAAYEEGEKKLRDEAGLPKLKDLACPLHDGDVEKPGQAAFENCFYLNAKSKDRPKVIDRGLLPITDPAEIYSGCIVNASVTLFTYKSPFGKGISAALNGIQLVKKGERIGWGPTIGNDFEVLPEDDEEDDLPF